ncbi:cadherin-like beta sandwich domain-containing protein [Ruthenibacterium lactatiformans]|uniref:DUF4430 domain-containing protein n=1 Tax=Ruthenibacterium lactatiformans TaxID=1550024 RepID=A0A6I3QF85_9FIRM|nr:cadherin-like beta sandwich domain-containing protein [Ruthenibacterium lactatiformans]MTS14640.1 DUF4430 domain-containing protein [Ruthenibacterium lactatiformans]MTS19203.1 DUF4430 domain-containing protein [Ruthenibacterium lactatiformans]MTS34094.1 DUF4430 domain-containing protein [Ruthenibacterium lactatiformans]MTS47904.1 DUF4430 domain-containing protein [Ruthenibacterium lactatiformans]MTS50882.1 DUF4430 domain-containing protein [Ruthenibacterium lactatiformans]
MEIMKKKIVALLLVLAMALSLTPILAFAEEHDNQVHVIVENSTFTPDTAADVGAEWNEKFWHGVLVDTWVELTPEATMMSSVVDALASSGYEQTGAENNYISSINGLAEFDGGGASGWMGTLNDWFTNEGFGAYTVAAGTLAAGDEIHIMYTCSYGDDLGGSWANSDSTVKALQFSAGTLEPAFDKNTHAYTLSIPQDVNGVLVTPTASNKNYQVRTRVGDTVYKRTQNVPVENGTEIIIECNWPGSASMNPEGETNTYTITVQKEQVSSQPQDVSAILNEAMAQMATNVSQPQFGSIGGEWAVIGLARGEYMALDNPYFTQYYDRIVQTVNETASSVGMDGVLHKNKSTENSRLILALSAIGKTSEKVGEWNLLKPFNNNFSWVTRQGINGPIFALLALDSHDYQIEDTGFRQQCIDYILGKQLADGGWALSGSTADPDMTAMALQSLAPYCEQPSVKTAVEKAVDTLSGIQKDSGGYASWGTENSESIAQVIVACTALGINPDTDPRFVKGENSAVDALLSFYDSGAKMFCHTKGDGGNQMATEQGVYALVAYNRLLQGKSSLYDMKDVPFTDESGQQKISATVGMPKEISNIVGTEFNAVVNIDGWDNQAGYRLMDCVIDIPQGVSVTKVEMSSRISGGQVSYHLEEETGKLRIVYFDPENAGTLAMSGEDFPAEFFTIGLKLDKKLDEKALKIAVSGMSLKTSSDQTEEDAMIIIDTSNAQGEIDLVKELSFTSAVLYTGDGVDLIPENRMAVSVSVANLEENAKLIYQDGTYEYTFLYNAEISDKSGVKSYVALVDAAIPLENFVKEENFTVDTETPSETFQFGDTNSDSVINAQDALAAVSSWIRKTESPVDAEILKMNVNADARINTFDALGIVDNFVNGIEFSAVNKAVMVAKTAK